MSNSGSASIVASAAVATQQPWYARLRSHLLALRFALFNVVGFGLLGVTWAQGWLDGALAEQTRWPSAIIAAVFIYGLLVCAVQIAAVDRALNQVRRGRVPDGSQANEYLRNIDRQPAESRVMHAGLLRLRLSHPIGVVRHVANALVFLGLIGTVVGFIIALSGVKPELTASVDKVAPMVSTLITGMSIALYTTLIGAVLHVWLMITYRMLATGSVHLYDAIIELGEQRVGR